MFEYKIIVVGIFSKEMWFFKFQVNSNLDRKWPTQTEFVV
jgi:hypothetical protein